MCCMSSFPVLHKLSPFPEFHVCFGVSHGACLLQRRKGSLVPMITCEPSACIWSSKTCLMVSSPKGIIISIKRVDIYCWGKQTLVPQADWAPSNVCSYCAVKTSLYGQVAGWTTKASVKNSKSFREKCFENLFHRFWLHVSSCYFRSGQAQSSFGESEAFALLGKWSKMLSLHTVTDTGS